MAATTPDLSLPEEASAPGSALGGASVAIVLGTLLNWLLGEDDGGAGKDDDDDDCIVVYRNGSSSNMNFTPRYPQDFRYPNPQGAWSTWLSLDAINEFSEPAFKPGDKWQRLVIPKDNPYFEMIKDSPPGHVSIRAKAGTGRMLAWAFTRETAETNPYYLTLILKSYRDGTEGKIPRR